MQFSRKQRDLAIQAVDEAEERTGGYYCIPPHRWTGLRYDLLTCQDQEWRPLPESALAQVQLMQRASQNRANLNCFYRIQLNDPTILNAVHRERLTSSFYPFLVYILTHEMVHLVRLTSILENPAALPPLDESEERRVQRISHQILNRSSQFHPILEKFCDPRNNLQPPFSL